MPFSNSEKAAISSLAAKIAGHADYIGAETLERLFTVYPQAKTNFSHFDLSHDSKDLHKHGGKIVKAIVNAAQHVNDLDALSSLSDLHDQKLMMDPGNFKLLSNSLQVVMASQFPGEFIGATKAAWDKFLSAVSSVLVSKYR